MKKGYYSATEAQIKAAVAEVQGLVHPAYVAVIERLLRHGGKPKGVDPSDYALNVVSVLDLHNGNQGVLLFNDVAKHGQAVRELSKHRCKYAK